jgi:hypothetical protein
VNTGLAALEADFAATLCAVRPTIDPAREAAASDAVAGVLFDPLGAAFDGAAGIRSAIPLICRSSIDDPAWDQSTFSKNRKRLLEADMAARVLEAVQRHEQVRRFGNDGTLNIFWPPTPRYHPHLQLFFRARRSHQIIRLFQRNLLPSTVLTPYR